MKEDSGVIPLSLMASILVSFHPIVSRSMWTTRAIDILPRDALDDSHNLPACSQRSVCRPVSVPVVAWVAAAAQTSTS